MTWKNEGNSPHRIGDNNGTFKSAARYADKTFLHIGASLGEYSYVYTIRPQMVGKIIVKSLCGIALRR